MTVALVELYTARNCAGCTRAEHWLSELNLGRHEGVLPVVLPMDDRNGEGEPKAWPSKKLTVRQRLALVYRPYVLLQGREFAGWNTDAFDAQLERIHGRPAGVRLRVEIVSLSHGGIGVTAKADAPVTLYAASYRGGSQAVPWVLEWQGPFALYSGMPLRRTLPIPAGAARDNSGVLAFAQDRRTGEVLQALRLPAC